MVRISIDDQMAELSELIALIPGGGDIFNEIKKNLRKTGSTGTKKEAIGWYYKMQLNVSGAEAIWHAIIWPMDLRWKVAEKPRDTFPIHTLNDRWEKFRRENCMDCY